MLLKRIGVTICVCLIVLFSVPSISAYAYDGDYVMYLPNSYNLYDGVLAAQSKLIIGNSSNLSNFVQDKFDSVNSFMQSNYSNYDIMHYSGSPSDSGEGYLHIFDGVTNGRVFFYSASQSSTAVYQNCVVISDTPFTFSYRRVNNNGSTIGSSPAASLFYQCGTCVYNGNTYYFAGDNNNFFNTFQYNGQVTFNNTSYASDLQHGTSSVNLRYSSFPVYTAYEDSTIPTSGFLYFKDLYKILEGTFTPINDPVNAFTSSGVVEDYDTDILPDEVEYESNENHLYLKSCDVGFCKPTSVQDLGSAGGGYVYIQYTFDNWINNHSGDYHLDIRPTVQLDNNTYNGILNRALDLNGLIVLSFDTLTENDSWTNSGFLFVEFPDTIGGIYKKGYVYSIPYPVFAAEDSSGVSNRSRFLGNGRNRLYLTPEGGRGYDITSDPLGDSLESLWDVQEYETAYLSLNVRLVDNEGNESGQFIKRFNLKTGVGTVYDNSVTDNDNPFEPDPEYPSVPDGSDGDSSSFPTIYNQTVINANGTLGFDPGYRELKQDIDADPNGNFTQYLDPLKNDSLGEWFMSFINAFPPELKVLLISGTAAGVGFGIYRFVRRG